MTEHTPTTEEAVETHERSSIAEGLARIGVAIGAQRTELYQHSADLTELVGWWAALGFEVPPPAASEPIPLSWFPWTLGNIRQARHVFVRNAGPLPLRPQSPDRIHSLRMGSSLHLPVTVRGVAVGAVCAYWAQEREDWPAEQSGNLATLARELLDVLPEQR